MKVLILTDMEGVAGIDCWEQVTGDEAACGEARELLGEELTTVAVKEGITRYSSRSLAPVVAREKIEQAAFDCLQNLSAVEPYKPGSPTTIKVELATPDRGVEFQGRKVEFVDARTVVSRGKDFWEAWDQFWGYS